VGLAYARRATATAGTTAAAGAAAAEESAGDAPAPMRVALAAIAAPNLPIGTWRDDAPGGAAAGTSAAEGLSLGVLFSAAAGAGAHAEPLEPAPGGSGEHGARLAASPASDGADIILAESFDSGHSDHATSARIAASLGIVRAPIRIDSMVK
jgi:hypothetical protein